MVRLIRNLTNPVLEPIRSLLPRTGMIDLSPMIALSAIYLLQSLIAGRRCSERGCSCGLGHDGNAALAGSRRDGYRLPCTHLAR